MAYLDAAVPRASMTCMRTQTQIDAMELAHANPIDAKKHTRISRWLEPHRHAKHYSSLVGRI